MSEAIGFIGLGNLGFPMASNLLNAGYPLWVYNRTRSKAEPLVAQGAHLAPRPVDAVTTGGIVATLVWDDAAVESIVMSDGFLECLGQGGIHLSMSTILPETARKLADIHAEHGCTYVAAPIFGGAQAAAAHELWIPIAGPQPAKERVQPILKAMGGMGIFDFGEDVGASTLVKLLGNFLIISARHTMDEALVMAEKNGVDPKAVMDMLAGPSSPLLPSPIYRNYGKRFAERLVSSHGNSVSLKDVGLFQKTAQQVDSSTPIANLLTDLMAL